MKNNQYIWNWIGMLMILLSSAYPVYAQQGGGIVDTEVIIEKDKPLTLPQANRSYQPTEVSGAQYETPKVQYSFSEVRFQPEGFQPTLKHIPYSDDKPTASFENYVKAAYGNFGSPLLEGQYFVNRGEHYMKAFARHESFSKGPVRDEESAFSESQIRLEGHLDGDINFNPFINWEQERYFFFGRDTANDILNPLIIDDRIVLQNLDMGVKIKLDRFNKMEFEATPLWRNTINKIAGGDRFASESSIGLSGDASFHPVDEFSIGLGFGMESLKYESVILLNRSQLRVNPYIGYKTPKIALHGGFEFVMANDSTGGEGTGYFYPDLGINLNITEGFTIHGKASGGLNLTSLYSLSDENRYLENGLPLLNQNNKLSLEGGLRTRILDQVFLDASLGYDLIENLPFFEHSLADPSRFTVAYDSGNISRTVLRLGAGYFQGNTFSLKYTFAYFGYSMNTLEEPWYKPITEMNMVAVYQPVEQLSLQLSGMFLGGIQAPNPGDGSAVKLPAIFDLGFGVEYKITENASILASAQNLTSTNYERYQNYPTRGLSFKLGFIYRF